MAGLTYGPGIGLTGRNIDAFLHVLMFRGRVLRVSSEPLYLSVAV